MIGKASSILHRLRRSTAGVAATEFALTLPFLLTGSLMGLEVGNQAIVQMQISQLAAHLADNASRIGDTSTLEDRRIYEYDLNDLFYGADVQGGQRIELFEHGRVIISSLEVVPTTVGQQYIHWQRCMGMKVHVSSFGVEDDGLTGTLVGMGPPGEEVIAFADEAVMFVEISYDYQPLVGDAFSFATELSATATFTVRNDRDLSQIFQRIPASPDPVADCANYSLTDLDISAPSAS